MEREKVSMNHGIAFCVMEFVYKSIALWESQQRRGQPKDVEKIFMGKSLTAEPLFEESCGFFSCLHSS